MASDRSGKRLVSVTRGTSVPTYTIVGVQNRAAEHPSGHVEWTPPLIEKYKGHVRHELPNAAANMQVPNRSLVAHSPEYLVLLMAAVTYMKLKLHNK